MLANLPAKRAARQIFPNLAPKSPNKKLLPNALNRKKILLKGSARGYKVVSTSSTTINAVGTNLALRKRRTVENAVAAAVRTRSSPAALRAASKSPAKLAKMPSKSTASSSRPAHAINAAGDHHRKKAKLAELGNALRRQTKAVVTKITKKLRCVPTNRILRTSSAHHSPHTSKNTSSAKLDKANQNTKKSKKSFLRTLSFRRSTKTTTITTTTGKMNRNAENPLAEAASASDDKSSNKSADTKRKSPRLCETESTTPVDAPTMADKPAGSADIPSDPLTTAEASVPEETPRLKRKRSIKTIINEMHAKCQSQASAAAATDATLKPIIEPAPVPLVADKGEPTAPEGQAQLVTGEAEARTTPVTEPLSLTIEPFDKPLDLCTSPQKHLAPLSTKSCASSTASTEQENISPRRRTRKLNDCIAMLTGKLQEKLGVPFIDESSALLPILSPGSEQPQSKPATAAPLADVAFDLGAASKPTEHQPKEMDTSSVATSSPIVEPAANESNEAPEQPAIESSGVAPLLESESSQATELPAPAAEINDSGIDMDIAPKPSLKDDDKEEPAEKGSTAVALVAATTEIHAGESSSMETEAPAMESSETVETPEQGLTKNQDSVVTSASEAGPSLEQHSVEQHLVEREVELEKIAAKDTKKALQQEENDKCSRRIDSTHIASETVSTGKSVCSKDNEMPAGEESKMKPEIEPQRVVPKRATKDKQPESRVSKKSKPKSTEDAKKDAVASEPAQNNAKNDENVVQANDIQTSDNIERIITDSQPVELADKSGMQAEKTPLEEAQEARKTRSSKQTLKEVNTLQADGKAKEPTSVEVPFRTASPHKSALAESTPKGKLPKSKEESNASAVDVQVAEPVVDPAVIEALTSSLQESPSSEPTKKSKSPKSKKEAPTESKEIAVEPPSEITLPDSPQKPDQTVSPLTVKSTRSKRGVNASPVAEEKIQIAEAVVDIPSEVTATDSLDQSPAIESPQKGKSAKSKKDAQVDQKATETATLAASKIATAETVQKLPSIESPQKVKSSKANHGATVIQNALETVAAATSEVVEEDSLQKSPSVELPQKSRSPKSKKETPKTQKTEAITTDAAPGTTPKDSQHKSIPVEPPQKVKTSKAKKESPIGQEAAIDVAEAEVASIDVAPGVAVDDAKHGTPSVELPQKSRSSKTKKETAKVQKVEEVSTGTPSKTTPAETPPKCSPVELPVKGKLSKTRKEASVAQEAQDAPVDTASVVAVADSLDETPHRVKSRSRKEIAAVQKAEIASTEVVAEKPREKSPQKAKSSKARKDVDTAREAKETPVVVSAEVVPKDSLPEPTPSDHRKSKKRSTLPVNDGLDNVPQAVASNAQKAKSPKSKKESKRMSNIPIESVADEQSEPKLAAIDVKSDNVETKLGPAEEPKIESVKPAAKSKLKSTAKSEPPAVEDKSPQVSKSKLKDKKSQSTKADQKATKATGKAAKKGAKSAGKHEMPTANDDSDEELLPWDPEKGFVTGESENVAEPESPSASAALVEQPTPATAEPSMERKGTAGAAEQPPDEQPAEEELPVPVPKVKKKRKCELAYLIADQLLESFKEVDQSRIDDLKKVHDLSLTNSGDLTSTSISTTPKPQRRSKKLFQEPEPKTEPRPSKKAKADGAKAASEAKKESAAAKEAKKESPTDKEAKKESPATDQPTDDSKPDAVQQQRAAIDAIESAEPSAPKDRKSSKKESKCKSKKHLAKLAKQRHQAIKVSVEQSSTCDRTAASKVDNTPSKILAPFSKATLADDTNRDTFDATPANAQKAAPQAKVVAKSLFRDTSPVKPATAPLTNSQPLMASISSYNLVAEKKDVAKQVTESLFSQKNPVPERLSDIIGLADKATLPAVPSLKNAVFPQWSSGIDKQTVHMDKDSVPLLADSKLNFWNRSNALQPVGDSDNSKLFGVIKDKAKHLFSKLSKKKLKKSIKSSIRDSSCSSSSSSSSSNSSSNAPKKPLLRPSILSCKNFRDTVAVKTAGDPPKSSASNDIFDSLRSSAAVPMKKTASSILSPQKLNIPRAHEAELKPSILSAGDAIVTATAAAADTPTKKDESLSPAVLPNLNTAFIDHKRMPAAMKPTRRQAGAEDAKKTALPIVNRKAEPKSCTDFDDDSQDTIISQIVSKIRENADRTDSDDEMCLDGGTAATGAGKATAAGSSATEPNDSALVQEDLSALVSDIKQKLEREQEADAERGAEKMDGSTNNDAEFSDNDDDDHDDSESVNTSFSQSTSITSGGGKKKRKKRSILSTRKGKRGADRDFTSPEAAFYCDICNKSYRNQHGLNNHKATIMHISKLSQLEFLGTKETGDKAKTASMELKVEEVAIKRPSKPIEAKPKLAVAQSETPPVPAVKVIEPSLELAITAAVVGKNVAGPADRSPYVSPKHLVDSSLSPEPASRPNGTPKHTPAALNARLNLSQEERLFYECCSMLKGSDRSLGVAELVTKPVTPKSSEENSNIAHAAQSPRSHPSPRPGIPRIELNQFSDASSDSNPAYSCPQVPSSSKTHKVFAYDVAPAKPLKEPPKDIRAFGSRHHPNSDVLTTDDSMKSSYPNSSRIVRNYPDSYSDMGDSFPSSQDAQDESEHYTRTILDRSNQTADEMQRKPAGAAVKPSPPKRSRIDYGTPANSDHLSTR